MLANTFITRFLLSNQLIKVKEGGYRKSATPYSIVNVS